jgi:multidrug efflux pump
VIVGGISFGTLFTLFVVPTAYTLLARTHSHAAKEEPAPAGHAPLPQPAE